MKYLFFFKGQPLLLCCVCCKISIQDFLTGLDKKNKKNLPFHRRNITRRYFTESCKKFTWFCHIHRRLYRRRYRRIIPMESPTDCRTHVWHVSVCTDTDGIADVPYRRTHRRLIHVWHVSVCTITDGRSDVKYRRHHRRCTHSDTCLSARLPTKFSTDLPTDWKVWRDFRTFLVRISINFRQNYRRKLIPPTAINFRR